MTELVPDVSSAPELIRSQIVVSGTAASEAAKIAALFASVNGDEALPSLCLADPETFPEVPGAPRFPARLEFAHGHGHTYGPMHMKFDAPHATPAKLKCKKNRSELCL